MEIKGEVPWKHPSKFWRDADDAQLISYVDAHYGTFSARNYDIAVTKVADDRAYHPIREFIESLPEWDKVPRVDTLLVDYLGAGDTAYVRAVTRKTLCAAISRVLRPGCKFDSMLDSRALRGKSTLIAKLAGEWFSDSLNLGDTKDKTAAEKLQGYWILEIGRTGRVEESRGGNPALLSLPAERHLPCCLWQTGHAPSASVRVLRYHQRRVRLSAGHHRKPPLLAGQDPWQREKAVLEPDP